MTSLPLVPPSLYNICYGVQYITVKIRVYGIYNSMNSVLSVQLSSVHSVMSDFVTPWTAACQASLSITNCRSLPKLMSMELVMSSNYLILCYPLFFLPSIFPSIRVLSKESGICIRWPKYILYTIKNVLYTLYTNICL